MYGADDDEVYLIHCKNGWVGRLFGHHGDREGERMIWKGFIAFTRAGKGAIDYRGSSVMPLPSVPIGDTHLMRHMVNRPN